MSLLILSANVLNTNQPTIHPSVYLTYYTTTTTYLYPLNHLEACFEDRNSVGIYSDERGNYPRERTIYMLAIHLSNGVLY